MNTNPFYCELADLIELAGSLDAVDIDDCGWYCWAPNAEGSETLHGPYTTLTAAQHRLNVDRRRNAPAA